MKIKLDFKMYMRIVESQVNQMQILTDQLLPSKTPLHLPGR